MSLTYSVVIAMKDEAENIADLFTELEPVMESLQQPYEIICIDDGSVDETFSLLCAHCAKNKRVKVLSFERNYGQSSAFAAGFEAAKGRYIITLDADRQNDPQDIPQLVKAIENADLVVGWRVDRKDPPQKRIISKLSNFVRSRLCKDGVHDTGCSLKIYRKEALSKIKMYKGMHRFLPALFLIDGFTVKEIPVKHRPRVKGKTKYHFFNRLIGPIYDMFVVRWMRARKLHHKIKTVVGHDSL